MNPEPGIAKQNALSDDGAPADGDPWPDELRWVRDLAGSESAAAGGWCCW